MHMNKKTEKGELWYNVEVREDLFDAAVLVCRWGTVGSLGRQGPSKPFPSMQAAEDEQIRIIEQKERLGYELESR